MEVQSNWGWIDIRQKAGEALIRAHDESAEVMKIAPVQALSLSNTTTALVANESLSDGESLESATYAAWAGNETYVQAYCTTNGATLTITLQGATSAAGPWCDVANATVTLNSGTTEGADTFTCAAPYKRVKCAASGGAVTGLYVTIAQA